MWLLDEVGGGLHRQECERLGSGQWESNVQLNAKDQGLDLIAEKTEFWMVLSKLT